MTQRQLPIGRKIDSKKIFKVLVRRHRPLNLKNSKVLIKSNRESGDGRYDIALFPRDKTKLGLIIEFKKEEDDPKNLKSVAKLALKQIEKMHYKQELLSAGVKKIMAIGMAFYGKQVEILHKLVHK